MDTTDGKTRRSVVVIGGGVAGSVVAKSLQFHADLTLIDPKEYFEIPWGSLRSMVEPSFGEKTLISHRDYLTNGRIVTSKAIKVTEREVLVADGRSIPYDYLVIATGHHDHVPMTRIERLGHYKEENDKIRSAGSILIVGGGPVGVELAGEIALDYPEKKITVVHNGSRLLEFIGQKASVKALDWMRSRGVDVKLDQEVELNPASDGNTFRTSAGETITADCHFICTGKPVASAWLQRTFLKDYVDKNGRLMVDQHLRVKGLDNVFAVGDITNIREIKQGISAQKHAEVASKNLRLLIHGGRESKTAFYEPRPTKAVVSLGRKEAVAQYPLTTVIGVLPGVIKSKDRLVNKTRKLLGLPPHVLHS